VSACGGGGGSDNSVTQPLNSQAQTLALGVDGSLTIPAGGLPDGTGITIKQTLLPSLTSDLIAVGNAWRIEPDQQPGLPAEIELPVPAGTNAANLVLARIEDNGRISLLQTTLRDNKLVARTPGFSTIVSAELQSRLNAFNPTINGPDFLPAGIAGQYSNNSLAATPSVQRNWVVYEHTADMQHQISIDQRPLWDSVASVSAVNPGQMTLMLEFTEAQTGLNVVAMKDVSVQQELEAGNALDITIYGPAVVKTGEAFSFSALAINTDITSISRWDWTLANDSRSGSCIENCSIRLEVNDVTLSSGFGGNETLQVTAFTDDGSSGSASMTIRVLDNSIRIVSLRRTSDDRLLTYDSTQNPQPVFTYSAQIEQGVAPYTYEWRLNGNLESHLSFDTSDVYNKIVNQPGFYYLSLTVLDNAGQSANTGNAIAINGAKPTSYFFLTPAPAQAQANQLIELTLQASKGILISNGQLKPGYDYLISWGDGNIDQGVIPATDPDSSAELQINHSYTSAGRYSIEYIAVDAREQLDVTTLQTIRDNEPERLRSSNIVITEPVSSAVISDFDASSSEFNDRWGIGAQTVGFFSDFFQNQDTAEYLSSGGNPGGALSWIGSQGDWWYFVTYNNRYNGDQSAHFGKKLNFDLKTEYNNPSADLPAYPLVVISGSDTSGQPVHLFQRWLNFVIPGQDWTHYSIPLNESAGWWFADNDSLVRANTASSAQIQQVLSTVSSLRILGEYGGAQYRGYLDNVEFGAN